MLGKQNKKYKKQYETHCGLTRTMQLCMQHKICCIIFCVLSVFIFAGCSAEIPTIQEVDNQSEQSAQEPEQIQIVISHSQNIGTPEDIAAKAMQSKLQELLGTRAEVILYADYQLGSAKEQLEAMQLGRVAITIQSAAEVSAFVEDMKVFTLPYLFSSDPENVKSILDGVLAEEALERIAVEKTSDFTGLGLWFGGYKLFTFSGAEQKAIHSPADFQGLKVAVPDAALLKAQYCKWGAAPVVVEDIARYSVLEQSIADGSEATLSQIVSNYLQEVQHNIVQAYHSAEIYVVLANAQWFAALPTDVQQAIIEAETYGRQALYEALEEQEPVALARIAQAEGMHFETLNEKQIAAFRESVKPLYAEQLAGSQWQIQYVEKIKNASHEVF